MLEGLDSVTKLNLIEILSVSLKKENTAKDKDFFESFGSFPSNKPAEEIIEEIKSARKFIDKDIQF